MVPVGEGAPGRMRGQVRPQPPLLRRSRATPARGTAVGVQRDEVPRPDVVTVVASARVAGDLPEVVEVPLCPAGSILVVAWGRARDRLQAAPGGIVRSPELGQRAVLVLEVAERKHR